MFGNILGKNNLKSNKLNSVLITKISSMNLSDMRVYVNNKLNDFEVCEEGLTEIMKVLVSKDSKGRRFIESDAMESKIKKAFDLVIIIAKSKKMSIDTTELIQTFIEFYSDIIQKFDNDNKQIYSSKLKDSITTSLVTLQTMNDLKKKMNILDK